MKADFEIAMGEEFGDLVSLPVPFSEASPHECYEAIRQALGNDVTPTSLANLTHTDAQKIAVAFVRWFECEGLQQCKLLKLSQEH